MAVSGLGTVAYEYDNANRLTEVAGGGQSVSLAYDKANRLESLVLPDGIEQLYDYDKAGETTSIAYKEGESTLARSTTPTTPMAAPKQSGGATLASGSQKRWNPPNTTPPTS